MSMFAKIFAAQKRNAERRQSQMWDGASDPKALVAPVERSGQHRDYPGVSSPTSSWSDPVEGAHMVDVPVPSRRTR